ncbi:MAG: RNA polymerase sigma factor [Ilumatobacteraceae bacterium]
MNSYGEIDEHALVDLARRDRSAFAELYRRHVQDVYAFARRRTGNAHDADDVTAVTFERALRSLNRYKPSGSSLGILAWLYRIATNEIIDQSRKRGRQQTARGQRALRLLHNDAVAADTVDDTDPLLLAALDGLPDRYNTVLSLRYIAGLDVADVAAHLGISDGNCAVLTHRALAALRTALQERTTE